MVTALRHMVARSLVVYFQSVRRYMPEGCYTRDRTLLHVSSLVNLIIDVTYLHQN
jgi:hypothetical protein